LAVAHLYFRHSTMNAGKSLEILKIANNYEEQGKKVLLLTHMLDDRYGAGKIASRVGLTRAALGVTAETDIGELVAPHLPVDCILMDEGQFLNRPQVLQLCAVVDKLHIPVIVYGLKNDFRNDLFEGSQALLAYADKIEEVKTVCWFCTRKATMNLRICDGRPVREGDQILIGGNESYLPVCRICYQSETLDLKSFGFFEP
jgi:thymidine kinase